MEALKEYLAQQLAQTLGQMLSEQELSHCCKNTEILEPTAGQLFWESTEAATGIYLIVEGKVRLSDRDDNLIVSLGQGASFGELTLFPEEKFQPHRARASIDLKLCYVKGDCLQSLIDRHPIIRNYLHRQAVRRDLLLLHHRATNCHKTSLQNLMKMLPLLEQHHLQSGKLPHFISRDRQLWLIRRGELVHSSGQKLTPGKIYKLSELPENGAWQVTEPTELYSLASLQWQTWLDASSESDELNSSKLKLAKPASSIELRTAEKQKLDGKSKIHQAYFPRPTVKVGQWWQHSSGRYPFYKQQSATDCGVACLVMVGRYWGKRFNVNHLRTLANVSRDGASLRGLVMAAESMGFAPRPVKAEFRSLNAQNLPALVHWEGNHYIVVYQVTRDRVIVGDPAIGRRILTHQAFLTGWTGYTLLLQPTALLNEAPEAQHNFWKFFELIKPHWFVLP